MTCSQTDCIPIGFQAIQQPQISQYKIVWLQQTGGSVVLVKEFRWGQRLNNSNFFKSTLGVHDVKKKVARKTNKSDSDFIRWTHPSSPACAHRGQDIQISLWEPCAKVRPRPPKLSNKQFTRKQNKKILKFLIFSTDLRRQRSPAEITARWRYTPIIKNLTPHYKSQFCVRF